MQLQQLRYVIAIAQSGSMNSVARKLFISQSSLSVAVKELESELGIRIFNRSSKGISLTSDGVEFWATHARWSSRRTSWPTTTHGAALPRGACP